MKQQTEDKMSKVTKKTEKGLDLYPYTYPKRTLKEIYGANYETFKTRAKQGKFCSKNIAGLSKSDLYMVIGYLGSGRKG